MARSLSGHLRWLRENKAWRLLAHPMVVRNYLTYQREMREKATVMTAHPPGVEIELTNKCNLACTQCLRSLGLKPYKLGSLDMDGFKTLLDQFPYVMHLSLNGFGEPFMSPILFDAVAHVRKERPWCKVLIYTNGMLLNEENIGKALRCGLTELNVSLDGGTMDTYKRVRRGGKLDVVCENIRNFLRMRREAGLTHPRMGLNFVMLNDNEGDLPAFLELAHELGVDYVNCVTYATYDWGFQNRRSLENYRAELVEARKVLDRTGMECRYFPEWDPQWLNPTRTFSCNFFWGEEFRVTYGGDVTLGCCTPFKEQHSYGNLFEQPLEAVWNGEVFRSNREMSRRGETPNPVCASCDRFARRFFDDKGAAPERLISVEDLLSSTDQLAVLRADRRREEAESGATA